MKPSKKTERYLIAAGKLQALARKTFVKTSPAPCANCGTAPHGCAYGSTWCDPCLHSAGFLPSDYADEDCALVFAHFFSMLSNAGEWDKLRRFAKFWDANRAYLLAGALSLDVDEMLRLAESGACPICGGVLGHKTIKGTCSQACYVKLWRRENRETLSKKQREKRAEKRKQQPNE